MIISAAQRQAALLTKQAAVGAALRRQCSGERDFRGSVFTEGTM